MTTEPTAEQIAAEMSRLTNYEQIQVAAAAKLALDSKRAGDLTGEERKALKAAEQIVKRGRR